MSEKKESIGAVVRRVMRDVILAALNRKAGPHSTKKGKRGYNRKKKHKGKDNEDN